MLLSDKLDERLSQTAHQLILLRGLLMPFSSILHLLFLLVLGGVTLPRHLLDCLIALHKILVRQFKGLGWYMLRLDLVEILLRLLFNFVHLVLQLWREDLLKLWHFVCSFVGDFYFDLRLSSFGVKHEVEAIKCFTLLILSRVDCHRSRLPENPSCIRLRYIVVSFTGAKHEI